jgi:hypothetical protein
LIEVSRSLIRVFRSVLKKITVVGGSREPASVVLLSADRKGLRIQARNSHIALEYVQPGNHEPDEIAIPAETLCEFESRKDVPVRFDTNQGQVVICWQDKAVPQIKQVPLIDKGRIPQMPELPTRMDRQPPELLNALRDASEIAGTDAIRYAVTCLQLRGKSGQIVSTDGKQMLAQSGFNFAWKDDVLLPASAVFGCRELHGQEPITLGKSAEYVTLGMGPWTLHLAINKDGRFPNVDSILDANKGNGTVLQFDPGDTQFLLGNLDSLPGANDDRSPVTIDANGQVSIRAKGDDQPKPTEIVLARSQV